MLKDYRIKQINKSVETYVFSRHLRKPGCPYLPWSDFDIEVVPLVGNFQNLWPGKSIYSESVSIY